MIYKQLISFCALFCICRTAQAQDTTVVKFRLSQSGVNVVTTFINDAEIDMIFDTGAERVIIPKTKAKLLEKLGHLAPTDYTGIVTKHKLASGDTISGREIIFREFKLGGFVIYDVVGSVLDRDSAEVLLGQSVLRRFTHYSIDNVRENMTFVYDSTQLSRPIDTLKVDCKMSLSMPQYRQTLGIKPIEDFWNEGNATHAIAVLERLSRTCPKQLPRKDDPETAALFERITEQKESMEILRKSVRTAEFKVQLIREMLENHRKLSIVYKESLPELVVLARINLDIFEQIMQYTNDNQKELSADTIQSFQKDTRSGLNNYYIFFQDFFRSAISPADFEPFINRFIGLTPLFVKFTGQPELKNIYTERLWLLSQFETVPSVKTALDKSFKALLPKNVSEKTEEDRELLLKRLKPYADFAKMCSVFEGRFVKSDKMDKISYRLTGDGQGGEIILRNNKGTLMLSGRIDTRSGIKQTEEYDVTIGAAIVYLQMVKLYIIPKLYTWAAE